MVLFQQVDEGEGAVVVPIEDGSGDRAVLRHFQQIVVLPVVIAQGDFSNIFALGIVRVHMLGVAQDCTVPTAVLYRNNDSALPLIDLLEQNRIP